MFNIFKLKQKLKDDKMSNTKYSFKKELNHPKNLKKALKLVKKYNIVKDIPFEKSLYVRYTQKDNYWEGKLGHCCLIELDKNNILYVYERNVFQNTIIVQIKLKQLLKCKCKEKQICNPSDSALNYESI